MPEPSPNVRLPAPDGRDRGRIDPCGDGKRSAAACWRRAAPGRSHCPNRAPKRAN